MDANRANGVPVNLWRSYQASLDCNVISHYIYITTFLFVLLLLFIIPVSCVYGLFFFSPSSVRMQARMAVSAPVLSPALRRKASLPHACGAPSGSHSHTRTVSVLVLLRAGLPPSAITTGRRYRDCSRRRKPPRLVRTDAVLSTERHQITEQSTYIYNNRQTETIHRQADGQTDI